MYDKSIHEKLKLYCMSFVDVSIKGGKTSNSNWMRSHTLIRVWTSICQIRKMCLRVSETVETKTNFLFVLFLVLWLSNFNEQSNKEFLHAKLKRRVCVLGMFESIWEINWIFMQEAYSPYTHSLHGMLCSTELNCSMERKTKRKLRYNTMQQSFWNEKLIEESSHVSIYNFLLHSYDSHVKWREFYLCILWWRKTSSEIQWNTYERA